MNCRLSVQNATNGKVTVMHKKAHELMIWVTSDNSST